MELFIIGGAVWLIGMGGYIYLDKVCKYKNRNFYDISDKVKKYKKVKEKTNIKKK